MSIFHPRRPRPFQMEYRYARPKRLISDRLPDRQTNGRGALLMYGLLLLLLILIILLNS